MQKTIMVGDKELTLRSSAATPYRYTQIFHEDFFKAITSLMGADDDTESIDVVCKLAYVMASQANNDDMDALNKDKFIDWLDGFEFSDFSEVLSDVVEVYTGSSKGRVDPK